ncbi:MAG: SDR family oxidoreductase [SAR86 cluster bacterium]|nr:SDR family oxidoreductase [SAR86 cluster bacterium]
MTDLSKPPPYPESHDLLKGKNIVVTAAAGTGIGFATAKRCIEEGGNVLISDIHEKRLNESAIKLNKDTGYTPRTFVCDVTNSLQADNLISEAHKILGPIDILINNAGLGGFSSVREMTDTQWEKVLNVSLTGTFKVSRAVLNHMEKNKNGVIINNASVLGWRAQANQSHYSAAKAGIMAFTRSSAIEAAEFGVRINAVSPSIAIHEHLSKTNSQDLLDELSSQEVFGRAAEPWEIANVIIFLASDYSSYMTGETISVSSQHP